MGFGGDPTIIMILVMLIMLFTTRGTKERNKDACQDMMVRHEYNTLGGVALNKDRLNALMPIDRQFLFAVSLPTEKSLPTETLCRMPELP